MAAAGVVRLAGEELPALHPIAAGIALVVGALGYVLVALWGLVGLTRAAWRRVVGDAFNSDNFGIARENGAGE